MPLTLQRARMPTRAQLCEAGCLDLVYSIEVRAREAGSARWPTRWRPGGPCLPPHSSWCRQRMLQEGSLRLIRGLHVLPGRQPTQPLWMRVGLGGHDRHDAIPPLGRHTAGAS